MRILIIVLTLSLLPSLSAADLSDIIGDNKVEKLAGGMKFTEGPVWLPKANKVVFSDIPSAKLMEWSKADGLKLFREEKNPNGNLLDLEGRLLTCLHGARQLIRTETDGKITVLADKFDGKRLNSPNDVAVKSDGTLWFTDPPWGLRGEREIHGNWVYRRDVDGTVSVVTKILAMPNGIAFSPDEKTLYVADTGGHAKVPDEKLRKAKPVFSAFTVNADNSIVAKPKWQVPHRCDGLCVDTEGRLYLTEHGGITVLNPDGSKIGVVNVPEGPANVCFGGPKFQDLYITARKSLYRIKTNATGVFPKR